MPRILRAVGAAALIVGLLAPTAAVADRWSRSDPEEDVVGRQYHPEPKPCGTDVEVDGSQETNEDITRLSVRHTRRAMVIATRFRGLEPDLEQQLSLFVRSSAGGFWLDLIRYQDGWWRTYSFLTKAPRYPDPQDIDECGAFGILLPGIGCRIGRDVDFAKDLVRLQVPRKCLGNPRWVRVGAESHRFVDSDDPGAPAFTAFSDEWEGGTVLTKWRVSYGPRVPATAGATFGATRTAVATTGERRHFVVRREGIFARR